MVDIFVAILAENLTKLLSEVGRENIERKDNLFHIIIYVEVKYRKRPDFVGISRMRYLFYIRFFYVFSLHRFLNHFFTCLPKLMPIFERKSRKKSGLELEILGSS